MKRASSVLWFHEHPYTTVHCIGLLIIILEQLLRNLQNCRGVWKMQRSSLDNLVSPHRDRHELASESDPSKYVFGLRLRYRVAVRDTSLCIFIGNCEYGDRRFLTSPSSSGKLWLSCDHQRLSQCLKSFTFTM